MRRGGGEAIDSIDPNAQPLPCTRCITVRKSLPIVSMNRKNIFMTQGVEAVR